MPWFWVLHSVLHSQCHVSCRAGWRPGDVAFGPDYVPIRSGQVDLFAMA